MFTSFISLSSMLRINGSVEAPDGAAPAVCVAVLLLSMQHKQVVTASMTVAYNYVYALAVS